MFPGVVWYSKKIMDFGVLIGSSASRPKLLHDFGTLVTFPELSEVVERKSLA